MTMSTRGRKRAHPVLDGRLRAQWPPCGVLGHEALGLGPGPVVHRHGEVMVSHVARQVGPMVTRAGHPDVLGWSGSWRL